MLKDTHPFVLNPELENKLEDFLNKNLKADGIKGHHLSVYSETTRSLFVFFQNKSKEYHIIRANVNTLAMSLIRITCKSNNLEVKPDFTDIYLSIDDKQICIFSKKCLAFLEVVKLSTDRIVIDITHTSNDIEYKRFKFANFTNYFGILLTNNTWRYYSTESTISEYIIDLIDINCVDFDFGPLLDIGWQNFTVFFLEISGSVYYSCPIIPGKFNLPEKYISNMKNMIRIRKDCEKYSDIRDIYETQNTTISLIEEGKCDGHFLRRKVLHTDKHVIDKFTVIDKRNDLDKLLLPDSFSELYILNCFPIVILRVSDKNIIEVLFSNNFINPTNYTKTAKTELYIVDSIYMKADRHILPRLVDKNETRLLFTFSYDIIEVDLSFITNLNKLYKNYNGQDLRINIRSKIAKIRTFEATGNYYAINKIDLNILLINISKSKFNIKVIVCKEDQPKRITFVDEIKNELILKSNVNYKDIEVLSKR
jgi:hypothetical protein